MSVAMTPLPAWVRQAKHSDLDAIWKIENAVYEFPWTRGIFSDCMKAGYGCFVYENDSELFGYGITSLAEGECHILNLCIEPSYQGAGWGKSLLGQILEFAQSMGCRIVFLEVRLSNTHAFSLYTGMGFNEVTIRKNYYPATGGVRENAFVLAKNLI